jgi:hypothetical protein
MTTAAERAAKERAEQGLPPLVIDPVVLAKAAEIMSYVQRVVDEAPPLTEAQRVRIRAIFTDAGLV